MRRSRKRRIMYMVVSLFLALVVALVPIALFWPSGGEEIAIGKESWTMPGGGPAHTAYLPLAPRGPLHERWNTRLEGAPVGPPAIAGGRAYFCCDNGFIYCLDLEDGKPVWRYDVRGSITAMPAVYEGGILVGCADGRVVDVGPDGELLWEVEVGGAVMSTPIPLGGRVYFGSSDGFLYCVSAGDGDILWSFNAESRVEVSPCIYEGQVFVASYEGDLFALSAADGRLVWTFRSGQMPLVHPAADDGRVFLATEFSISCVDAQSGKSMWEYPCGPGINSNLVVRGNQLIAIRGGSGMEADAMSLDTRTGDSLWDVPAGSSSRWTASAATNADLYMAGPDQLRAMNVDAGTPTLEYGLRGILPETLTLTETFIIAATDARKVYCLEE